MILLGNLMIGVAKVLDSICFIYIILFIAAAVLSWVSPDPRNPIVRFIYSATEPVLQKIRAKIPPIGMLDLSVIVAIFGLYLVQYVIVQSLIDYGLQFRGVTTTVVGG